MIANFKISIEISSMAETAALARLLAQIWQAQWSGEGKNPENDEADWFLPQILLLQGDLGAGKTTLTRQLVEQLPGGKMAEVSSPSFTLCNSYACEPPVLHFDLYRLPPGLNDDDLADALELAEGGELLLIIEWPERIAKSLLPASFLHCNLILDEAGQRRALLAAGNAADQAALENLAGLAAQTGLAVAKTFEPEPAKKA